MSTEVEATTKAKERKEEKKTREEKAANAAPNSKDKMKKNDATNTAKEVDENLSTTEKHKKRKRKDREAAAGAGNKALDINDGMDEESTKKKQKKRRDEGTSDAAIKAVEGVGKTKPKKAKKKYSKHKDEAAAQDNIEVTSQKTPAEESRKKLKKQLRKNDVASCLLDPGDDAELTDKARGALSYAYTRLSSPDSWKFNKAHQNWIVKHYFTQDAIPEKYLPIVVGYLAGCQGGVREKLIQACNKQLETLGSSPELASSQAPTLALAAPAAPSGASAENADANPSLPISEDILLSPETLEAIKTRARVLLKALVNA